jgi:hypothetical protein
MNSAREARPAKFTLIHGIMVAVLIWGGYLAVGAFLAPGNHAIWRGFIVFGCTLTFLGFWAVALAWRRAALANDKKAGPA